MTWVVHKWLPKEDHMEITNIYHLNSHYPWLRYNLIILHVGQDGYGKAWTKYIC